MRKSLIYLAIVMGILFFSLRLEADAQNHRFFAGAGWMETEVDIRGNDRNDGDFAYNVGLGFDVFVKDRMSIGLDGKRVWGTGDVNEV